MVFSAGQSEAGRELSARHADNIFAIEATLPAAQALYREFKDPLGKYVRGPDDLKILAGFTIFVGETAQQADDLAGELDDLVPPAVGVDYLAKMTGLDVKTLPLDGPMIDLPEGHHAPTGIANAIVEVARKERLTVRQTYQRILPQMADNMLKGDPTQIADVMEERNRGQGCDGFMVAAAAVPTGMERFTRLVIPELQRRGLFRREYEGRTLREHLGLKCPVRRLPG